MRRSPVSEKPQVKEITPKWFYHLCEKCKIEYKNEIMYKVRFCYWFSATPIVKWYCHNCYPDLGSMIESAKLIQYSYYNNINKIRKGDYV